MLLKDEVNYQQQHDGHGGVLVCCSFIILGFTFDAALVLCCEFISIFTLCAGGSGNVVHSCIAVVNRVALSVPVTVLIPSARLAGWDAKPRITLCARGSGLARCSCLAV